MKNNILNLFFIVGFTTCVTTSTSYTQKQPTSDFVNITETADEVDDNTKSKLTEEIEKLIVLLQKSSEPTLENKVAALCTAAGIGGSIGLLTGSTYRLCQNRTLPYTGLPINYDMSDFFKSSALVGIPLGLVVAGLSFLALKKMIQSTSKSELNSFAQKLNDFKIDLSNNEPLNEDDQIKLKKIITLASIIFEKNNHKAATTALKKTLVTLGGSIALSYLGAMSHLTLLMIVANACKIAEENLDQNKFVMMQICLIQAISSFLIGSGLSSFVANKFLTPDSINLVELQEAIIQELQNLLPSEASAA